MKLKKNPAKNNATFMIPGTPVNQLQVFKVKKKTLIINKNVKVKNITPGYI